MKILLYPNPTSQEAMALCARMTQMLCARGHKTVLNTSDAQADLAVVFGGDGTVLRAVHAMPKLSCPIWAVNCGHLGYLSACENAQAEQLLDRILAGDYRLEKRMMLQCKLMQDGETQSFSALNEIVMHRGINQHALRLEVKVNGEKAMQLHGDGVIVCTPTGSTAYNLSAGGPVMMPESEMLAVTPICAHAPAGAPMVLSAQENVRIRWKAASDAHLPDMPQMVVDGECMAQLRPGCEIAFARNKRTVQLIRTMEESFCQRLQSKLKMNPADDE